MIKEEGSKQLYHWTFLIVLIIYFFYSTFNNALFNGSLPSFDRPLYTMITFISIFAILLGFYLYKLNNQNNFSILIIMSLLPISFVISYFFSSSGYMALNSILIHSLYLVIFTLGYVLASDRKFTYLTQGLIIMTSYIIVIFGLMNWFNNASFWGIINYSNIEGQYSPVYSLAVITDSNGERLTSIFQYANTYAGYLIAVFIASLFITTYIRRLSIQFISAFMLIPIMVSFLLTLSRGGLIILPIMLIIILIFFHPVKQIIASIQALIAFIISGIILKPISNIGINLQREFSSLEYIKGFAILIVASLLFTFIVWCMRRYVERSLNGRLIRISSYRFSNLFLPITIVLIISITVYLLLTTNLITVLPDTIEQRFANINFNQHSVLERGTFYSDAIIIFLDYPIFGAGGGGWSNLYQQYQSYPYISSEAHNFFIQYMIEIGIFGCLSLLLLLILTITYYLRYIIKQTEEQPKYDHFIFFIFAICIIAHSIIDFNLSFVFVGSLTFLCLGALGWHVSLRIIPQRLHNRQKIYPVIFIVASIIVLVSSSRLLLANHSFQQSINYALEKKPYDEVLDTLNKAVSISKNPHYLKYRLDFYQQGSEAYDNPKYYEEAVRTIEMFQEYEPYDRPGIFISSQFRKSRLEYMQAATILTDGVKLFPWDIEMYEEAILLNTLAGNTDNEESWDIAIELFRTIEQRGQQLKSLPSEVNQGRPFNVTPSIASSIAQIYYFRTDYASVVELLLPYLPQSFNTLEERVITRFYLASLTKLYTSNDELYQLFTTSHPDEIDTIKLLLSQ